MQVGLDENRSKSAVRQRYITTDSTHCSRYTFHNFSFNFKFKSVQVSEGTAEKYRGKEKRKRGRKEKRMNGRSTGNNRIWADHAYVVVLIVLLEVTKLY